MVNRQYGGADSGGGLRENGAARDFLKAYEADDFHEVVQRLMRFCSVEMGLYLPDIIKDR